MTAYSGNQVQSRRNSDRSPSRPPRTSRLSGLSLSSPIPPACFRHATSSLPRPGPSLALAQLREHLDTRVNGFRTPPGARSSIGCRHRVLNSAATRLSADHGNTIRQGNNVGLLGSSSVVYTKLVSGLRRAPECAADNHGP